MDLQELRRKISQWDTEVINGEQKAISKYTTILNHLEHHSKSNWCVYLPTQNPEFNSSYMERLASWVGNVKEENEQKLLLEYALEISFFSHSDFVAMYHTAFQREILPWLANINKLSLSNSSIAQFSSSIMEIALDHTWYCPITDSMDINEFYKVNHIAGIGYRPGFRTLKKMASHGPMVAQAVSEIWRNYMSNPSGDIEYPSPSLRFLVLLEDVVGSGNQAKDSINWAIDNLDCPILFVPLS